MIRHSSRRAFMIHEVEYTYREFQAAISKIRGLIRHEINSDEKLVALLVHDDLETYASILALWFEGKGYLPLKPDTPTARNHYILNEAGVCTMLNSRDSTDIENVNVLNTKNISCHVGELPREVGSENIAYLLFTSGSTGLPKGVPITRGNLSAFVDAFEDLHFQISSEDRCLQMFDLTFDMSVFSIVTALLHGASLYTIPHGEIKYTYSYRLMEEHHLTIAIMVPSVINYLSPYFDEINLPDMRGVLFAGEALYENIAAGWAKCLPNARIENACGPTETTIICTSYTCHFNALLPVLNGIVTIGKAMKNTEIFIGDEVGNPLPFGENGEIYIAGPQVFPGYINDEKRNQESFIDVNGKRFFKSGDMALMREDGIMLFTGRKDSQVQVDGYRVELAEIEYHVRENIPNTANAAVIPILNEHKNNVLYLVIESEEFEIKSFIGKLKLKLPPYMIPSQTFFMPHFPLNANGKTDRIAIKTWIEREKL